MSKSQINIAISASSFYIRYASVMMASLYGANPKHLINLYIFYIDDQVLKYRSILERQNKLHNSKNTLCFIKVDINLLNKVDNGKGWALDLWCRWYAFDFLANRHDRVLLLGVDTLIRGDLEDFFYQSMDGYYFSGVSDMHISNNDPALWPKINMDMRRVGFKEKRDYINGDVILVNLKEIDKKITFKDFLNLYYENQFTCWDQDVINYCFSRFIKVHHSYEYNYFPNLRLENIHDNQSFPSAKIVHFAGGPKPWNIAPWNASNFSGISEWWSIANKEGFPGRVEYIRYAKQILRRAFNALQR